MSEFITLLFQTLIQLVLFCLLPFIWWLITDRRTNFFRWIGFKKAHFKDNIYKTFAVIIVVLGVYSLAIGIIQTNLLSAAQNATNQFAGKGLSAIPSILLYAVLQTSLCEELFFRGFLCKRLIKQFGFIAGNLTQSILFGLLHGIPFGLATGKWYVYVLLTLLPTIVGFLFGWLNEKKAEGSIFPSWILHALTNVLAALLTI